MAKPNIKKPKPGSMDYACARIGVSEPTLYKLIRSGHLQTFTVGRRRLTTDAAIEACIARLMSEQQVRDTPKSSPIWREPRPFSMLETA
jgi:excisionase family DNA binding protein